MEILKEVFQSRNKKQNKIEKIKELKTPMSVYEKLDSICAGNVDDITSEDSTYFFKCFGLYLKKDGKFMLRIRVPAGQLSIEQALKTGMIAQQYGEDYIDITTRQQLELRFLKPEDIPYILKELDSVGLTSFQTGVDNFRNIVTSSFDGLGTSSIIECKPIIDKLQAIFLKKEEWLGVLPRKFNTAILGNGVNDCNIYGHDCCFVPALKDDEIGFNLYLGGKVGVQAKDTGLFVKVDEVIPTFKAVIELFKQYGFRDNRNKNRLHFLLEAAGMNEFIKAIKLYTGLEYKNSGKNLAQDEYILNKSGVFDLGDNLSAVHFSIPSGILKGSDLIKAAKTAVSVEGEIRLSVEQSFYIVVYNDNVSKVKDTQLYSEYDRYHNIYFNNQIACAGTATCAFGVIPNKPDAIEMAEYLNKEIPIDDGKVRMYWSGCVKGCGIHGIADIGFEGCKAKDDQGNPCHGVHIYVGGKASKCAKEAEPYAKSVPLEKAKLIVKDILTKYKNEKLENETFEQYDTRMKKDD